MDTQQDKLLSFLEEEQQDPQNQSALGHGDLSVLSADLLAELRDRGRKSLYLLSKGILGYSWLVEHIHGEACEILEDREILNAMFVLPRGWYKTTLVSISYPIFESLSDPNIRILIAQNTMTNATSKLASIGDHFERNDLFMCLYPELLPDKTCIWTHDKKCVKRDKPAAEATFEAAGIRTQVVGRHYDRIIEDDTVAPDVNEMGEENIAPTKDDIGQAIGWHKLSFPLLVHPDHSRNIIVGTRWFEKDLISHVRDTDPSFTIYQRAVKEDEEGNADPEGHITFPEKFSQETLDKIEARLGPYMFSCLYLNLPIRSEQMIFRSEWFQLYETPPAGLFIYTTQDLATDPTLAKGKVDYNVTLTCGLDMETGNIYVLNYVDHRANPGEVLNTLFAQTDLYQPLQVGIESIAYQKSLLFFIKQRQADTGQYFTVTPITGGGKSKVLKIQGLQPYAYAKRIFVRPWMRKLLTQAEVFPFGSNDDIIDALSMQLELWPTSFKTKRGEYKAEIKPYSLDEAIESIRQRKKGQTICPGSLSDIYALHRSSSWQNN